MTANTALRHARERRGWSQATVAQRIDSTVQNIGRWERGSTRPSPYFREKLCQLFDLDAEALGLVEPALVSATPAPASTPVLPREPILDPMRPRFPIPLTQVIGRQSFLDDLLTLLQNGTICTLYGLPGVGKTTLAQLVTMHPRCQSLFPDGVLWISLGSHPDIHSELLRLTAVLQAPEDERRQIRNTQELAQYIQLQLRDRHLLLVIDDAWNREEVRPLLPEGPHIGCLVTTRLPELALTLFEAQPLPVPELDAEQSSTLLTLLAPHLADISPETIPQVLQYTGGLPLALTLLGYYLRTQSIGGQRRRVETALTLLTDASMRLNLLAPQRPTQPGDIPWSLATIIGISDHYLSPEAQEALRALSILPAKPESFSEAVALMVSGHGPDILDRLLDAGLIEGAGEGRYSMHQVIADYARLQHTEMAPLQRLVSYAQQVCTSFNVKHIQSIQNLYDEYQVILEALRAALSQQQNQNAIEMILALVPFWGTQGFYEQADQWLQTALSITAPEKPEYAHLLAKRARFATLRERWEQAQQDALKGIDLSIAPELQGVRAAFFQTLGQVALYNGNDTQARTYYEQGLSLARTGADRELTSSLLNALGSLALKQGNYQQAELFYEEGLALARQDEHLELISEILAQLGKTLQLQGDYYHAEKLLREGLAHARRLRYRSEEITQLLLLGVTVCEQGDYAQGKILYLEGLALARQSENLRFVKRFLMNLGAIAIEEHEYELAEQYFREGLVEAWQTNDKTSYIVLLTNLGTVQGRQGAMQEVETTFEECLQLARELGDPWLLSNALCSFAEIYLDAQQIDAAEHWFLEALAVYRDREPNRVLVAMSQFGLAQVAAQRGKQQEARQIAEQCLQTFLETNHRFSLEVQSWLDKLISAEIEQTPFSTELTQHSTEPAQPDPKEDPTLATELACPHCGKTDTLYKHGKTGQGVQRYRCRHCNTTFRVQTDMDAHKTQAYHLAQQGMTPAAIAQQIGVHRTTIQRWLATADKTPTPTQEDTKDRSNNS